jgi:hypothetical protein
MGILDKALAVVDNYRRVAGRNVSDLIHNPSDAITNTLYNAADTAVAQIKAATEGDVSYLLPGGNAASGAKLIGTFAGQSAKTFPFAKLDKFIQMEEAGTHSAKKIFKETGLWRGSEGKLRYEIPDTGMKLKPAAIEDGIQTYAVEHPDLVAAYPNLQKLLDELRVKVDSSLGKSGSFNPKTLKLQAQAPDLLTAKNTVAHELQHTIQETENFARGGNPKMFDPVYKPNYDAIGFQIAPDQLMKAESLDPYQAYLRIAGEAESRAVENQLTKALSGTPGNPLESFDIPFDKMIQLPR